MSKHTFLKALLCTAVLAAFPVMGLTASAEDAEVPQEEAVVEVVQQAAEPAAAPAAEAIAEDGDTLPIVLAEEATTEAATEVTTSTAETTGTEETTATTATTAADGASADAAEAETTTAATTASDGETTEATTTTVADLTVTVSNKEITVGDTAQITAQVSDAITADFMLVTYWSSDDSIATVDEKGVIHAKKPGDVTIYCTVYTSTTEIVVTVNPEIYSVLMLDVSGSMYGDAMVAEQKAAVKYCEEILASNKDSHIAVVALGSDSDTQILTDFTSDLSELKKVINQTDAISGTEYAPALELADSLLSKVPDTYIRNIVLCSDGEPWDEAEAIAKANEMKDKYHIYTLGFFHSMDSYSKTYARNTLTQVASNTASYYEVDDPAKLTTQFQMIANDVSIQFDGDTYTAGVDMTVKAAPGKAKEENSPSTGENNDLAVYVLIALFGCGAMALTAKKREN